MKECGSSVHQLFESTLESTLSRCKQHDQLLFTADALNDYCNEVILMYHFKDVPVYWRRMLMDVGLLKVLVQLGNILLRRGESQEKKETQVQLMIRDLDTCCIVSGSPGHERRFLSDFILDQLQTWLTKSRQEKEEGEEPKYKKFKVSSPKQQQQEQEIKFPIERLSEPPNFEWFLEHCNQELPTPFIMPQGVIDDWPAFHEHPWGSMDYLLSIASDRIVPVEIGSQYTDSNWRQHMMRFGEFIQDYILQDNTVPAYLAQHDLFYQIPRLEKDILVPDYCYIEPKLTKWYSIAPQEVMKNAWFGPKGTISPLHQDPYHNLLVQVVGKKYIKLVSPEQTEFVYPRGGLMTNTSEVRSRGNSPFYSNYLYMEFINRWMLNTLIMINIRVSDKPIILNVS